MKGHGSKWDRKREQAILALLQEPTVEAAAKAVGVADVTLWRWMQQPDFQAEYRIARRVSRLEAAVERAYRWQLAEAHAATFEVSTAELYASLEHVEAHLRRLR